MAKTEKRLSNEPAPQTAGEAKIEAFAEDLGRLLGTARAKAEGWLDQRKEIAQHLVEIRDTATRLLAELGHTVERAAAAPRRARAKRAARAASAGKTKRRISPEGRARIAEAQRRRWAAQRASAARE